MRALQAYGWPGNIRELENVVERALIMSTGPTLAFDPVALGLRANAPAPASTLEAVERAHIVAVLEACDWKVSGAGNAAERLGLNRSTLQFRMKKLGIARPGEPETSPPAMPSVRERKPGPSHIAHRRD
jgi:transcriptional regulator of acetoin/glycerol metabolism